MKVIERWREYSLKHVVVVSVEADVDALKQDLVEHAPDVVWGAAVCISAVCGEFDRHCDEVFGLFNVGVKASEFTGHGGEFLIELLLLGAEHLKWDSVVVVRFEQLALLTFDLQLCR